jgi:uncharacterized protein
MHFNLMNLLLPREDKFFDYLSEQAANLHEGCRLFRECLDKTDEESRQRYFGLIKACEHRGDALEMRLLDDLYDAFITPIDREDIHAMVTEIDTALDILNGTARKMELYRISTVPETVLTFADHIVAIVQELRRLLAVMKTKASIKESIAVMHRIENEADELFHRCMVHLFSNGNNAVEIIKMKEIYERLESVVDVVDRVGKIVRGIHVKAG